MKVTWKRIWARKYAPFMAEAFLRIFATGSRYPFCRNKLFIPEGNLHAIYVAENEFDKVIRGYRSFLLRQDMRRYARTYEGAFQQFLRWAEAVHRFDLRSFSPRRFQKLTEELSRRLIRISEWQFLSFVVLEGPAAEVERSVRQWPDASNALEAITTPYRETLIVRARTELLTFVARRKATRLRLRAYVKRYEWLTVYDFTDAPLTLERVRSHLPSVRAAKEELETSRARRGKNLERYRAVVWSRADRKLRKLVEITHAFAYLKEMRDDYRRQAFFLLRPFWEEVSRRTGLTLNEANFLLHAELLRVLKTGATPFRRRIEVRKREFALSLSKNRLTISTGPATRKVGRFVAITASSRVLEGMSASPGRVRARVRIIFHQSEFGSFHPGEVLVTTMTHPEFVPIMRRASAIVTDEGGITSHAAIISRELGIPCIIGTKVATQWLKDGDRVEVDANKGIVVKL